jgi:hypothetical protein
VTREGGIARELGEKTIPIKAKRKRSTKREGAKVKIKTRLKDRANKRIQVANKLMIKETVRKK